MTPKPPQGFRRGGASQPFAHPKIWGKTKITARRGAKSLHPNPGGLAHPRSPACGGGAQIWGGWGGGYDPQPRISGRFCPQNKTLVTLTAGPGGPAAPVSPSLPGRPCGGDPPPQAQLRPVPQFPHLGAVSDEEAPRRGFGEGGAAKPTHPQPRGTGQPFFSSFSRLTLKGRSGGW